MASRRNLKKDVNWLTHEVITDCLIYLDINSPEDEKPVADIISNMISKRGEVLTKINRPTSKIEKKEVKQMYNEIVKDLLETTDNCFENLSKLSKK